MLAFVFDIALMLWVAFVGSGFGSVRHLHGRCLGFVHGIVGMVLVLLAENVLMQCLAMFGDVLAFFWQCVGEGRVVPTIHGK